MKSVEEYFSLHYDLKNEMIRLSKEGNDIRKAFITKIYCVPKREVKSNYNDLKKIVGVFKQDGFWAKASRKRNGILRIVVFFKKPSIIVRILI